jgi:hypothetical protein
MASGGRRPSGRFPADTAPAHVERPGAGMDDLGTRMSNMAMAAGPTSIPTKVKAAAYLYGLGDREVAEVLGVVEYYDRIAKIREREAVDAAMAAALVIEMA